MNAKLFRFPWGGGNRDTLEVNRLISHTEVGCWLVSGSHLTGRDACKHAVRGKYSDTAHLHWMQDHNWSLRHPQWLKQLREG